MNEESNALRPIRLGLSLGTFLLVAYFACLALAFVVPDPATIGSGSSPASLGHCREFFWDSSKFLPTDSSPASYSLRSTIGSTSEAANQMRR